MTNENEPSLHEKLCAYILGEGTPSERAEIERELQLSPELRAQHDTIERTIGLVKNAMSGSESLSPEAAETLVSAASMSRPTRWQSTPWLRIAAGLGAVTLAFAILRQASKPAVDLSRVDNDARVAKLAEDDASREALHRLDGFGYVGSAPATKAPPKKTEANDKSYRGPGDTVASGGAKEANKNPVAETAVVDLLEAQDARKNLPTNTPSELAAAPKPAADTSNESFSTVGAEKKADAVVPPADWGQGQLKAEGRFGGGGGASPPQPEQKVAAGQDTFFLGAPQGTTGSTDAGAVAKGHVTSSRGGRGVAETAKDGKAQPVPGLGVSRPSSPAGPSTGGPSAPGAQGPTASDSKRRASIGYGGANPPKEEAAGAKLEELVQRRDDLEQKLGYGKAPSGGVQLRSGELQELDKQIEARRQMHADDMASNVRGLPPEVTAKKRSELVQERERLQRAPAGSDSTVRTNVMMIEDQIAVLDAERDAREQLEFEATGGFVSGDRDESFQQINRYYWQLPVAEQQAWLDRQCRRIVEDCVRRPFESPRDMFFRFWGDNAFEVAALDKLSTFAADVDTASYALARRYINEGHIPEKAQIRTEEFVNYFKSDVPAPTTGVFAIHTDLTPSRFSADTSRQMLRVVLRGKDLSKVERKPLHLTFVVDVSGSMREQNRLEMVKHSIRLLVTQLDAYDKIGIVKFSSDASLVLPMTSVADRATIESKIDPLQPEGSTNSNSGLQLGYAIAMGSLDANSTSRVVFLSDGVANVGETDPAKIAEQVKPMREKGIYLNTIGVGMNNHNDVLLEQLADKADGMCTYIDSPAEAKRQLVDNFTGAFQPIARDVKIQVEFDPTQVLRYRLLGYENRAVADADFRNDKIDAGELGAGHQVTALYEIERQSPSNAETPLATVRVRWKEPKNFGTNPEQDSATEISQPVLSGQLKTFEAAGQSYRKAAIAAQFAEILRRSIHARGDSLDDLLLEALRLQKEIPSDTDFTELTALIGRSKDLILRTMPACDDLCQTIDQVRDAYYRRAQLEQIQKELDARTLEDLKRQNDILEARLRELIRRRLESQGK